MKITDKNIEEIIESGKPVLIDLWASWCGPCKTVAPIIEKLSVEYTDKIIIGKMDVDENVETPAKYGVRNIPTLLFFKDGKVVDKIVGSKPKSEIVEKLNNLL